MDTEMHSGGMGVGAWAIAIILLIGLFGRNGSLFGGGSDYCGNGVGTRDILETVFANTANTNSKVEALATQSANQFYNLAVGQKDLEIARLRDENFKQFVQLENAQTRALVIAGNEKLSCQISKLPQSAPVYACGGVPQLNPLCAL